MGLKTTIAWTDSTFNFAMGCSKVSPGCKNCFPAGTDVLSTGRRRDISEIEVNDQVLAYNHKTDKVCYANVVAKSQRLVSVDEMIRLLFEGGPVYCTPEHPFFETSKGYTEARHLQVDDEIFFMPPEQIISQRMVLSNPMFNPIAVSKVVTSLSLLRATGQLKHDVSRAVRMRLSERMKKDNPMFNTESLKRSVQARLSRKGPSLREQAVIGIIDANHLPVWYSGDGGYWVGRRNPDFKVHGQKKVIETYCPTDKKVRAAGYSYWRDTEWETRTRNYYALQGYECLLLPLRQHRLKESEKAGLLGKIQNFISNGAKLLSISKLDERAIYRLTGASSSREIMVYNLQTDTENFFIRRHGSPFLLAHNCYMYRYLKTIGGDPYKVTFTKQGELNGLRERLQLLGEKIFINDMTDTFHEAIRNDLLDAWFRVFASLPSQQFQILTKRAERMSNYFAVNLVPKNVWLGVSVESQLYLQRIEYLRSIDAPIRFVSFEPLLGPLHLPNLKGIDWLIIGGESGDDPSPMRVEWAQDLIDYTRSNYPDCAIFFKQMGGRGRNGAGGHYINGQKIQEFPKYQ